MSQVKVILFSQSIQFLNVTKKSLQLNNIQVKYCTDKLDGIQNYITQNTICIVQVPYKDEENAKNIIDFFNGLNVRLICVGEDRFLNFLDTTKGCADYLTLKQTPTMEEYKCFIKSLIVKIRNFKNEINLKNNNIKNQQTDFEKIIAIGASTGGTEAVQYILKQFAQNMPPVFIVIHMPPGFTKMYSIRLNEICKMYVKEAEDGEEVKYGTVYIAPGGYHMRVLKRYEKFYVSCKKEQKISGHMPSVNALFDSIAKNICPQVVATILTGMGDDGAKGLLNIKNNGGFTIGQAEKSCVVYGMPKVAKNIGAVNIQADLEDIPKIIIDNL